MGKAGRIIIVVDDEETVDVECSLAPAKVILAYAL